MRVRQGSINWWENLKIIIRNRGIKRARVGGVESRPLAALFGTVAVVQGQLAGSTVCTPRSLRAAVHQTVQGPLLYALSEFTLYHRTGSPSSDQAPQPPLPRLAGAGYRSGRPPAGHVAAALEFGGTASTGKSHRPPSNRVAMPFPRPNRN